MFALTAPPKLGRLLRRMPDNSTKNVSTFTQSMVGTCVCVTVSLCSRRKTFVPPHFFVSASQVNDGVILYDQKKPESVGWSAADSFSFTVSSPPAFLPPHTFTILISYQANEHHDNPHHKTRLLNNAGAVRLLCLCKNLSHMYCIFPLSTELFIFTNQNRSLPGGLMYGQCEFMVFKLCFPSVLVSLS